MSTLISLSLRSAGLKARVGLTRLGSRLGSLRGSVHLGSVRLGTASSGTQIGLSWLGSGLGSKLGSTRFSPGSGHCWGWTGKRWYTD